LRAGTAKACGPSASSSTAAAAGSQAECIHEANARAVRGKQVSRISLGRISRRRCAAVGMCARARSSIRSLPARCSSTPAALAVRQLPRSVPQRPTAVGVRWSTQTHSHTCAHGFAGSCRKIPPLEDFLRTRLQPSCFRQRCFVAADAR
jgi:hypothetical protein